jgi:quercetin dioxygenase-like cupin family protein
MAHALSKRTVVASVLGSLLIAGALGSWRALAATDSSHGLEKPIFKSALPNVPGKTLTAIQVDFAPGTRSPRHAHAGSVFAFVLRGKIRSENSATGPARVYQEGEGFFEPPGSIHTITENASQGESASLLAVFVADDDAQLTRKAP